MDTPIGAPLRPVDEKGQAGWEVSEREVPVGVPTWLDMTPKTRRSHAPGPTVLSEGPAHKGPYGGLTTHSSQNEYQMTLCGSEVPQDRWRGRTAGSGMWTRTRESAIMEPLRDSAIPYG